MLNKDSAKHESYLKKRSLSVHNPKNIDFYSNDYLGMSEDLSYLQKICQKVEKKRWVGSTGSRLLSGTKNDTLTLEKKIAHFHGSEEAVVFTSGFQANFALASCSHKIAETALYDEEVHASIKMGLKHFKGNVFPFRHNNPEHLDSRLRKIKSSCVIFIESIYSMDGSLTPFEEIATLCKKYSATLIVDEAHSFGVFGDSGQGLLGSTHAKKESFIRIITYGKSMGAQGASILGSQKLKEMITNFSYPFIYSTAPCQFTLSSIDLGYDILKTKDTERKKLNELVSYFIQERKKRSTIKKLFLPSSSHIQGYLNIKEKTLEALRKNKINCCPIRPPTVKRGQERLRISLHAFNKKSEIDLLLDTLEKSYV